MYDVISGEELAKHVREFWDAWESNDPDRIHAVYRGGDGFGYRTRAPRASYGTREDYEKMNEQWWAWVATLDHFIFKADEIHTKCHGTFGLAWGFYHEEIKAKGKAADVFKGLIAERSLSWWNGNLSRLLEARRKRPESFISVDFRRTVGEPIALIEELYARAGLDLSDAFHRNMAEFLENDTFAEKKNYTTSLEEYGIDAGIVNEHFAEYRKAFGLA